MANTSIEWTQNPDGSKGKTWNPLRGCSKVSEGCRNCYAVRQAHRFARPGQPYEGLTRSTDHGPEWTGKVLLVPHMLDIPLRWKKPERVFVNSMSDLFHPNVPDDFIDQVFAVMALAPQHTFQILTKRPERMLEYLTTTGDPFGKDRLCDLVPHMEDRGWISPEDAANIAPPGSTLPKWPEWPLLNVWIGVSVENQKEANERIPLLLQTPAAVRFLSCEPLLGPVNLKHIEHGFLDFDVLKGTFGGPDDPSHWEGSEKVDWIIVGGESGPKARPMHPEWVWSLRDQCQEAGVPFFFKQWGEWAPESNFDDYIPASLSYVFDDGSEVWRVGKKEAGRLLDGREWNEFPEVRT